MTYKVQIDDVVRDATAAEAAAFDKIAEQEQAEKNEAQAQAEAKAALLAKLGITEDEAKLLLG